MVDVELVGDLLQGERAARRLGGRARRRRASRLLRLVGQQGADDVA